jgi:hypothetical protein
MSHLTDSFDNWADRGMARITNPQPKQWHELPTARCAICDERFVPGDEQAEMFFPDLPARDNLIVHAECGLARGMEIA